MTFWNLESNFCGMLYFFYSCLLDGLTNRYCRLDSIFMEYWCRFVLLRASKCSIVDVYSCDRRRSTYRRRWLTFYSIKPPNINHWLLVLTWFWRKIIFFFIGPLHQIW